MEDTGQDSNGLWKEILGRCTVGAEKLALGIRGDSQRVGEKMK